MTQPDPVAPPPVHEVVPLDDGISMLEEVTAAVAALERTLERERAAADEAEARLHRIPRVDGMPASVGYQLFDGVDELRAAGASDAARVVEEARARAEEIVSAAQRETAAPTAQTNGVSGPAILRLAPFERNRPAP